MSRHKWDARCSRRSTVVAMSSTANSEHDAEEAKSVPLCVLRLSSDDRRGMDFIRT